MTKSLLKTKFRLVSSPKKCIEMQRMLLGYLPKPIKNQEHCKFTHIYLSLFMLTKIQLGGSIEITQIYIQHKTATLLNETDLFL